MKTIITLVVLAAVIFGSYFIFRYKKGEVEPPVSPSEMIPAGKITVEGIYTCLPHKDTSGPVTLECALGVIGEDGNNYAVDTVLLEGVAVQDIVPGTTVMVEGNVTPIEALSTDHWWKYDVRGIIQATKLEQR